MYVGDLYGKLYPNILPTRVNQYRKTWLYGYIRKTFLPRFVITDDIHYICVYMCLHECVCVCVCVSVCV